MSYKKAKLYSPSDFGGFQKKGNNIDTSGTQGTISGWVNLNSVNAFTTGIAYMGVHRTWWGFGVNASRQPSFFRLSWYPVVTYSGTTAIDLGKWNHIAVVYDSGFTFYVNGQPAGTTTGSFWNHIGAKIFTSGGMPNTYNGNPLTIDGRWSNVQVWDTNLSSSEIEAIYNNGTPLVGTQPQSSNLKIWDNGTQQPYSQTTTLQGTSLYSTYYRINNSLATETTNEVLGWSGSQQDGNPEGFTVSSNSVGEKLMLSCWFKWQGGNGAYSAYPFVFTDGTNEGRLNIFWSGSGRYARVEIGGVNLFGANEVSTLNSEYGWQNVIIYIPNTSSFNAQDVKMYFNNEEVTTNSNSSTLSPVTSIIGWNGSNVRNSGNFAVSNWAVFEGLENTISNRNAIVNNGSPGDITSLNPKIWYKLNSSDVNFAISGSKANAMTITDSSSNNISATGPYDYDSNNKPAIYTEQNGGVITSFIAYNNNNVRSFTGPAVSTSNGISSGMTSANLVTSTLTRQVPYNSYSLNFDGTDDVNCGDIGFYTPEISFSCWIYPTGNGQFIKYGDSGSNPALWCLVHNSTDLRIYVRNVYRIFSSCITLNQWHHVAITRTNYDNGKVYVNGVSQGDLIGTAADLTQTGNLIIGNSHNGLINNFSVFNEALTSTEVLKLYNGGVPGNLSNFTPSPISWWSLGSDSYYNGANYICPDLIGTNNGTSNGMDANSLEGNAPNSTANGTSTNMTIGANLTGSAPNSSNNSFSVNMSFDDRETDVPS